MAKPTMPYGGTHEAAYNDTLNALLNQDRQSQSGAKQQSAVNHIDNQMPSLSLRWCNVTGFCVAIHALQPWLATPVAQTTMPWRQNSRFA
jgi:hypothetical protein